MDCPYTCAITKKSDGWEATFPALGGYRTSGDTREECLNEAKDLLTLLLCGVVEYGAELPEDGENELVEVVTHITPEVIEETHYVPVDEVPDLIEIGPEGLAALVESGEIATKEFHGVTKVSIESCDSYRRKHLV